MPANQSVHDNLRVLRQHSTYRISKNNLQANQALLELPQLTLNINKTVRDALHDRMTAIDLYHLAQCAKQADNNIATNAALQAISNLCRDHRPFQNAIHQHGGVDIIINIAKNNNNDIIRNVALNALSRLAENNQPLQQHIYQSKFASRLLKKIFVDQDKSLQAWALHLLSRLLHNNPRNQQAFTDNGDIKYLMIWLAQNNYPHDQYATTQAINLISQLASNIPAAHQPILEHGGTGFLSTLLANQPSDSDQYALVLGTLKTLLKDNPKNQTDFCKTRSFQQFIYKLETLKPAQFNHAAETDLIGILAQDDASNLVAINAAIDRAIQDAAANRQQLGLNLHNWLAIHHPVKQAHLLKSKGIQHLSTHLLIHRHSKSAAYKLALQTVFDLCAGSIENKNLFCQTRAFKAMIHKLDRLSHKSFKHAAERSLLKNLAHDNIQAQDAINAELRANWRRGAQHNLIPYNIHYPESSFDYLDDQPEKKGTSISSGHVIKQDDKSEWFAKAGVIANNALACQQAVLENVANAVYQELCGPGTVTPMAMTKLTTRVAPAYGIAGDDYDRSGVHCLSKIIADFTPLGCIPVFKDRDKQAFTIDVTGHGPLEVKKFGEALAVAAVFNDIDFIGGSGNNGGTRKIIGPKGRIHLQFVKIDHGCAFTPSETNPIADREFQVATAALDKIMHFDTMPVNVRHEFLETLQRFINMPKERLKAFFIQPTNPIMHHLTEQDIQGHLDTINTRLDRLQLTYRKELTPFARRSMARLPMQQARQGIFTNKHAHPRWRATQSLEQTLKTRNCAQQPPEEPVIRGVVL